MVIIEKDGEKQEPYENITIDIEEQHQGPVMEQMGMRKGDMTKMIPTARVVSVWNTSSRRAA